MGISVVISNFNGKIYLKKLIESLYSQKDVSLQIIVVDRLSHDQSLDILKSYSEVIVVSEPPQSGLVSGYTKGLEAASQDLLFFCNEDMFFEEHCLSRLQQAIHLDRRICAADPWQWDYPGNKLLHGGTRFKKTRWALHSSYPFRNYSFLEKLSDTDLVPFACAGAFLIHRQAFLEVGGWDTSFFIDNEDVDLFLRLWQKGWHCVNVPTAKVFHDVGGSAKKIIHTTGTPVSKRRYLSDWASKLIVAVKYFSLASMLMSVMNGFIRSVNNLRHGRVHFVWWDILVLLEIGRRLPSALKYRISHRKENTDAPGERYFTFEKYQA